MSTGHTAKRRIAPQPVHDDEVPETTLPAPTVILSAAPGAADVSPPEAGRRIIVDLAQGYEVNYTKLLKSVGAVRKKVQIQPGPRSDALAQKLPGMPGLEPEANEGRPAFQKSFARVERMAKAMFNPVDGEDEEDSEGSDDDPAEKGETGDVAVADWEGSGDEEEEPQVSTAKKYIDNYDLLDDFIDDSEVIDMMIQRDTRQTKHTGFFVNHGAVERVGEKKSIKGILVKVREPVPGAKGKRKKADEKPSATDPEAGAAPAPKPKASSKAKKAAETAAKTDGASDSDGPKAAKKAKAAATASKAAKATTAATAGSVAQAALAAANAAAVDARTTPAEPVLAALPPGMTAGLPSVNAAASPSKALPPWTAQPQRASAPAASPSLSSFPPSALPQSAAAPAPQQTAAMRSQALEALQRQQQPTTPFMRPAAVTGEADEATAQALLAQVWGTPPASTTQPVTAAARASSSAGAAPPQPPVTQATPPAAPAASAATSASDTDDHAAHAARMNSIVVALAPEEAHSILHNWDMSEELRAAMLALRATAARTPPDTGIKKRKMPDELQRGLEGLVRLFYKNAESAPNANKAKAALWRILFQILGPWCVDSTIKTKMQQINSRIIGELGLTRDKLTTVLNSGIPPTQAWMSNPSECFRRVVDDQRFVDALGDYVQAYAAWLPCDRIHDAAASQPVWDHLVELWSQNVWQPISREWLISVYQKYLAQRKNKTVVIH